MMQPKTTMTRPEQFSKIGWQACLINYYIGQTDSQDVYCLYMRALRCALSYNYLSDLRQIH